MTAGIRRSVSCKLGWTTRILYSYSALNKLCLPHPSLMLYIIPYYTEEGWLHALPSTVIPYYIPISTSILDYLAHPAVPHNMTWLVTAWWKDPKHVTLWLWQLCDPLFLNPFSCAVYPWNVQQRDQGFICRGSCTANLPPRDLVTFQGKCWLAVLWKWHRLYNRNGRSHRDITHWFVDCSFEAYVTILFFFWCPWFFWSPPAGH